MQIYMRKKLQISDVFSGLKSRMGLCLLLRNNNNDNNNNNLHTNPQLYTLLKTLLGFSSSFLPYAEENADTVFNDNQIGVLSFIMIINLLEGTIQHN